MTGQWGHRNLYFNRFAAHKGLDGVAVAPTQPDSRTPNLPPLIIYKIKQIRLDRLVLVSGGGQATGRGLVKQH